MSSRASSETASEADAHAPPEPAENAGGAQGDAGDRPASRSPPQSSSGRSEGADDVVEKKETRDSPAAGRAQDQDAASGGGAEADAASDDDLLDDDDGHNWPLEHDPVYREFFRLKHPDDSVDKVSLMACRRQGVDPSELLFKASNEYSSEVAYINYLKQREKKYSLVREERARLVVSLYTKATAKFRKMKAVEARVNTVSPGATSGGGDDGAAGTPSTTKTPAKTPSSTAAGRAGAKGSPAAWGGSASPAQSSNAVASHGTSRSPTTIEPKSPLQMAVSPKTQSAEINEFVNRQLRQVLGERQEELDRQRLQQVLLQREQQSQRLESEKAAKRERDRKAAQAKRSQRLESSRFKTEYAFLKNRLAQTERVQQRSDREAVFGEQQAAMHRQRREDQDQRMSVARNRWEDVLDGIETGCRDLRRDIESQLSTHEQRKREIMRQQQRRIEQRRAQRIERLVHQAQCAERQALRDEATAEAMRQNTSEIERRCADRQQRLKDGASSKADEKQKRLDVIEHNRSKIRGKRDARIDEMIETAVQKERYMQRQEEDRREALETRKEENRLKMDNSKQNLKRLDKKNEYQAMMQRVNIELGLQQKIMLDRERKRQAVEREVRKQQCEIAKKQVKEEIAKLRMEKVKVAPVESTPRVEEENDRSLLAAPPSRRKGQPTRSGDTSAAASPRAAARTPEPQRTPNTTYNTCGSRSTPATNTAPRHGRRADTAPQGAKHGGSGDGSPTADRFSYLPGSDQGMDTSKDTTMFVYTNPPIRAVRGR